MADFGLGHTPLDSGREYADMISRQLGNAKTERELPLAKRDLLSQIEQRESSSRYTDALANRSEETLDLDVKMKEAEVMEKTQKATEFVNNKEYRDQANKLTWMGNEAKLKLAVEDPETFSKYVMATDRYNNAKAAEAEYDVALDQEYSMYQEYYNIAEQAGKAGNYESANQYIEAVAKKHGRPVPEFLAQGFNSESQIGIKKALNNNVLDRDVAKKLAEPKTTTLEERLISELPPAMQVRAKAALLNKKLQGDSSGTEFERSLGSLISNGTITPEEANSIRLNKVKNDASGKQSRVSIVNTPDGPQIVIEEGSNLGPDPVTANRADELIAQRDFLDQGVDMIDSVISDPQTLGAVASIAKAIRTGTKVGEDLFVTFPGAAKVVDSATNMLSSIVDPKDFDEANQMFNPETLDQLSILENSIGLLLARSRTPDNRIPVDVIKRSIDDVQLSGLRSDDQIRNRLAGIKKQLERQVTNLNTRIPGPEQKKVIRYDSQGNRIE